MELKTIILKNFRGYQQETKIEVEDNLTAFIGKNDVGKSTLLEALEIFFNNNLVKIDNGDACVYSEDKTVKIGCIFTDIPEELVLDSSASTSLENEYLLNQDGHLEIYKEFDCSMKNPKENVYVFALHPTAENVNDLLFLKQSQLKKRLEKLKISEDKIDQRSNPSMRSGIWNYCDDLKLEMVNIPLNKEDAKVIWESLKKELPLFALFQADRPSTDGDSEVQDPMKFAVEEAIKEVQSELDEIEKIVKSKTTEVAQKTIEKLKEMDLELANELSPQFKEEPKWANIFKLTLTGDNKIPINKRGSGVRRLMLLNFFRAESERKQIEIGSKGIIYAIEEPETSQHPINQKLLVEALTELSEQKGCQVLLTTHVPGLTELISVESLRYIEKDENSHNYVRAGDESTYKDIANDLGILPDKRIQVLICIEGPHDVNFLKNISSILSQQDSTLPDLSTDPRVAFLPLGGSTLKQWVEKHYLEGLQIPEIHIYDKDIQNPPTYQQIVNRVNSRTDGSWATLTNKREMENYLHPDAIKDVLEIEITFGDDDDVPNLVVQAVNNASGNKYAPINEKRAKKYLNDSVVKRMTYERLQSRDLNGDIISWFKKISEYLS